MDIMDGLLIILLASVECCNIAEWQGNFFRVFISGEFKGFFKKAQSGFVPASHLVHHALIRDNIDCKSVGFICCIPGSIDIL